MFLLLLQHVRVILQEAENYEGIGSKGVGLFLTQKTNEEHAHP